MENNENDYSIEQNMTDLTFPAANLTRQSLFFVVLIYGLVNITSSGIKNPDEGEI